MHSGALADTSRVSHTCLFKILPELYPICVSKAYMKCRWFWSFNLKPVPKISQSIAANSYVKSDPKPFWSQIFPPLAPSLSSKWDSLTEQIMITSHGQKSRSRSIWQTPLPSAQQYWNLSGGNTFLLVLGKFLLPVKLFAEFTSFSVFFLTNHINHKSVNRSSVLLSQNSFGCPFCWCLCYEKLVSH